MSFDAKHFAPALWSLDRVISWLEGKPKNAHYCYISNGDCLWAQYLKENVPDAKNVSVGGDHYSINFGALVELPGGSEGWANRIAVEDPRTFGAALDRAQGFAKHPRALEGQEP